MIRLTMTPRISQLAVFAAVLLVSVGIIVSVLMKDAYAANERQISTSEHIISVHDGGVEKGFFTKATTLRDALKEASIRVDPNDRTEPGLDEKLVAHSYEVNIYRARPVIIRDGASETRIVTAFRTGKQIAEQAKITVQAEDIIKLKPTTDIISDGAAEIMTITRATPFIFSFYGKTILAYSQEKTVGAMLAKKGIKPIAADTVIPSKETTLTANMTVKLWRNGKQTITQDEEVNFETEQIKDADRDIGYKAIKSTGQKGSRTVTYEIIMQNGFEVSRKETNSVITKQPVKQVETVGAKYRGAYTTPSENESITWNFLIARGLTREQTAGIMGNIMQEHKFNTTGDGLAQWTGGRKAALLSLPDPYSIDTQLDFMWGELNGGYARVLADIRSQSTIEGSVRSFQNGYERCGICREDLRVQYAYNIYSSH